MRKPEYITTLPIVVRPEALYVDLRSLWLDEQKHVQAHPRLEREKMVFVPCNCPSGGGHYIIEREHLKELLKDYAS